MHLFYAEEISGNKGRLGKEESHHAHRVLRMNEGDRILATLGEGTIYNGRITSMGKPALHFEIEGIYKSSQRKNYLHIAIAPTKSLDRFEFFLEKATETGVDEITPVISFHSERKIYKTDRGEKIIRAAAKQSLSEWLPRLNTPLSLRDFMEREHPGDLYIAHCDDTGIKKDILSSISSSARATILIGPEGDFSRDEITTCLQKGFEAVTLGPKRLRTETAGITVAIASKLL